MIINNQKGIALLIAFFVMSVALSVALSFSVIFFNQIKIISAAANPMAAIYAAESGIEKALYFDRKNVPGGLSRGMCRVCSQCQTDGNDPSGPPGIHCNNCTQVPLNASNGCATSKCNSCVISFNASFAGKTQKVIITLDKDAHPSYPDYMKIEALGGAASFWRMVSSSDAYSLSSPDIPSNQYVP